MSSPLYLHGIGHVHPPNVITNKFLEDLDIGTSETWIRERLGILERHTALGLDYIRTTKNADMRASLEALEFANVDAGQTAAMMAFRRADLHPKMIGLLIAGSSCPIHTSPPESCIIADRLGISAAAFDLHSACNGFLAQLSVAHSWLEANAVDFALLVQCEHMTRTVDYSDRTNASLMGDGTTAAIVSRRVPARIALDRIRIGAATSLWEAALVSPLRHFRQKTTAVRTFAENQLAAGVLAGTHEYVIFHQANLRLLESSFERIGLSASKHLYNVDNFGNCASAGCPSVVSQNWERVLEMQGTAALSTVGGGLTYGSAILSRIG